MKALPLTTYQLGYAYPWSLFLSSSRASALYDGRTALELSEVGPSLIRERGDELRVNTCF